MKISSLERTDRLVGLLSSTPLGTIPYVNLLIANCVTCPQACVASFQGRDSILSRNVLRILT